MSDKITNVQELKDLVANFVKERQWNEFHTLKNLSMSISIEAAELMELFQWTTPKDCDEISLDRIREELADVVIYSLSMANVAKIDLATAVKEKLAANVQKYPIEEFRGRCK